MAPEEGDLRDMTTKRNSLPWVGSRTEEKVDLWRALSGQLVQIVCGLWIK